MIKNLLIDVRDSYKKTIKENPNIRTGLCSVAKEMHNNESINQHDLDLIFSYFKANLPIDIMLRDYTHLTRETANTLQTYCWPSHEREPRLKWLEKHINL